MLMAESEWHGLIVWRDSRSLDWWGDDLVFHILSCLEHEAREDVPEEHRAALMTFRELDDDRRYEVVKAALEACGSY